MIIVAALGSPSMLSNVMISIDLHADFYARMFARLRERGIAEMEARPDAEAAWTAHVQERAGATLYMTADNLNNGGKVPGKPRVLMLHSGGGRACRRKPAACETAESAGVDLRLAAAFAEAGDGR